MAGTRHPLSFTGLKGVDGNLKLSVFQVKWNGAEFGPAELSGTLKDGKLETAIQDASLYGGKATAKITLDGTQDSPVLQLVLDAAGDQGRNLSQRIRRGGMAGRQYRTQGLLDRLGTQSAGNDVDPGGQFQH